MMIEGKTEKIKVQKQPKRNWSIKLWFSYIGKCLIILIVSSPLILTIITNYVDKKNNVIAHNATAPADNSIPVTTSAPTLYDKLNIDKSKVIVDSPNYQVNLPVSPVKSGENVKFSITLPENSASIDYALVQGDSVMRPVMKGSWIDDNTYTDTIYFQYMKSTGETDLNGNNQIEVSVFISPLDTDQIYQYKFDLSFEH